MTIIDRLNSLATKTPDEIARSLNNPWQKLAGSRTNDWYAENRDRLVVLYNASERRYHEYSPDAFTGATMRTWGIGVWTRHTSNYWYWAFLDEAVTFQHGVHDVETS